MRTALPAAATVSKATAGPAIAILAQYLKDLSFESPNAPGILVGADDEPQGALQVDVHTARRCNSEWEVSLRLSITARHGGQLAYVIELDYAGLVRIGAVSSGRALLMVEAPGLLFPMPARS